MRSLEVYSFLSSKSSWHAPLVRLLGFRHDISIDTQALSANSLPLECKSNPPKLQCTALSSRNAKSNAAMQQKVQRQNPADPAHQRPALSIPIIMSNDLSKVKMPIQSTITFSRYNPSQLRLYSSLRSRPASSIVSKRR